MAESATLRVQWLTVKVDRAHAPSIISRSAPTPVSSTEPALSAARLLARETRTPETAHGFSCGFSVSEEMLRARPGAGRTRSSAGTCVANKGVEPSRNFYKAIRKRCQHADSYLPMVLNRPMCGVVRSARVRCGRLWRPQRTRNCSVGNAGVPIQTMGGGKRCLPPVGSPREGPGLRRGAGGAEKRPRRESTGSPQTKACQRSCQDG